MRRWLRACVRLWERLRSEHSTPREIGFSIAAGVLSGCTPFLGFHAWIAVGLATVLRLNRLWAFLGSRVSFTPIFVGIAFLEIEVAHRLRSGAWLPLSPQEALEHTKDLFGDWLIGATLVGTALAAALGLAGYLVARRWQISPQSPHAHPRRPSESLPSTPPAPNP